RQRALREKRANSQSELDEAEANLRDLQAEADRLRAVIVRKQIIAPYPGKAGIRKVNIGDMLQVGDPVVTVNAYETLYVDFSLPQSSVHTVKPSQKVEVRVDSFPEQVFEGTVSAIESEVDPLTRNFSVQATMENKDSKLRPGMFVKVSVVLPQEDAVVAIPASSVSYAPYGNSVWILDKELEVGKGVFSVRSQIVSLGRTRGDLVEVFKGVDDGDEIVSSGIFKLRPGVQVLVNNSVQPSAELNPNPSDS
ncbi:MAG: efflux RND transporter periplasmic adaptor subunit, partial [Bdellovibrionales bacterium]|nr:efflux RND transporter periplasmic adaptor subunit [Bdellovibrionales bacterium]